MVRQRASKHVVAFKTDIGHSHRVNQDAGGAWTLTREDGTPVSMTVVADGVSAGTHSEDASQLTVELFHEKLSPLLNDPAKSTQDLLPVLLETSKTADRQVAQRPHESLSQADATTLVAALCIGNEGCGVWCGDSRVYRVAGDGLERLTTDHSWAQGVVSDGLMTAEDAARDPRAHMITRWLGPPEEEDPGVEAFRFELEAGDFLLSCSDGLYMYFAEPFSQEGEMAELLKESRTDVQTGVDRLVEVALERGGHDNVTAAAIYLPPPHEEEQQKEASSSTWRLRLSFGRHKTP